MLGLCVTVCGGVIQSPSGMLQSPGYPSNYPVSSNCSWLVAVPTGRTIRINFTSNFNIPGTQGSCGGDYLRVSYGKIHFQFFVLNHSDNQAHL